MGGERRNSGNDGKIANSSAIMVVLQAKTFRCIL